MCGADTDPMAALRELSGAPPRVRGGLAWKGARAAVVGSTPACAGRTAPPCVPGRLCSEHPRVCGADAAARVACSPPSGAPPRSGRTWHCGSPRRRGREHPRVCGADFGPVRGLLVLVGAPPRVRGGRRAATPPRWDCRSTPACAGRTSRRGRLPLTWAEHPRVCGADGNYACPVTSGNGAPPRVRGGPLDAQSRTAESRSTPACAGRTRPCWRWRAPSREHPRVCGADCPSGPGRRGCAGAPPRVRGGPRRDWLERRRWRSTPACAGRTSRAPVPRSPASEHPRVCGADDLRRASRRLG